MEENMDGKILARTGRVFRLILAFLAGLSAAQVLVAQESNPGEGEKPKLKIVILEGDGAINNLRQRVSREPVIQVVDENNKPVAGAMVMFTLPDYGAGASFANGAKTLLAYTNAEGKAIATGLKANAAAGKFSISVNASYHGSVASGSIAQSNAAAAAAGAGAGAAAGTGISKTLIAVLAVVGGAAAVGAAVALSHGNGGSASTTPPVGPSATINPPGNPVIGPPNN
jgi:hypothetical protein